MITDCVQTVAGLSRDSVRLEHRKNMVGIQQYLQTTTGDVVLLFVYCSQRTCTGCALLLEDVANVLLVRSNSHASNEDALLAWHIVYNN